MSSSNAASNVIPMRDFDRPAPQQAVQFDRLLQECRQLAVDRLAESIAGMLEKGEAALNELATTSTDRETRELYLKARDKVMSQRRTIQDQFLENYAGEFDRRTRRDTRPSEQFSQYDLSSLELGLVEDDDLEETLKINDMAAKLRRYCEEELAALDQRVGVLVGDANLQADSNPFSPQAICVAYKHTCRELESELKVRMVLHKLFDDHVLDAVRSIYKDLNALLVQRAILPKIRYGTARRNAAGAAASSAEGEVAELLEAVRPAGGPALGGGAGGDLFGMLQNLLAVNAGAMLGGAHAGLLPQGGPAVPAAGDAAQIAGFPPILGGGGAPAMLQGTDLLASLTRIQHGDVSAVAGGGLPLASTLVLPGTANVLRELKQTNVGSGMGQMDAMTLDIVAMLFDEIFDDDKIPAAMKGLIGRLQIPTLKVAILDKTFFSRRDHPTRLLLDSLGEIGLGLPAEFDDESPLYKQIESVLQKLIDGFREEIGIFDELREELERVIAEQNRQAEEEAARLAKTIEEKERLVVAKAAAQNEIRPRVQATKLPRSVVKFLTDQWLKLLLVAHAKNGTDSELWKTAISTMDLLIWSVNPSKTLDERRQLAAKLPGLLKRLNAGMQLIRTEEAARKQFFVRLMRYHTQIINGPDGKSAAGKPAAASATPARDAPAAAEQPQTPAHAQPPKAAQVQQGKTGPVQQDNAAPAQQGKPAQAQPSKAVTAEPEKPVLKQPEKPVTVQADEAAPARQESAAEPATLATSAAEVRSIDKPADAPPKVSPAVASPSARPTSAPPAAAPTTATPVTAAAAPSAAKPADAPPKIPPAVASPSARPTSAPPAAAPTTVTPVTAAAAPSAAKPADAPPKVSPAVASPSARPTSAPSGATPTTAVPVTAPAAAGAKPAAPAAPPAAPALAAATATPQPSDEDDLSLDFTVTANPQFSAVVIQNPFGDGQIEVEEIDLSELPGHPSSKAKATAAGQGDEYQRLAASLRENTWVEFRGDHDKWTSARLSYISPLKGAYLFVDRQGRKTGEYTLHQLARELRSGRAAVLDNVPLFDRAMTSLVGVLKSAPAKS